MADIGKSTSAHSIQQTQSGRDNERLLRNWGNWLSSIDHPGPSGYGVQPMFREYVAGYRLSSGRMSPENPDKAARLDRIIAQLPSRDVHCLICHYVLRLSSRRAARLLSEVEDTRRNARNNRDKLNCTNRTYTAWLEEAFSNFDTIIMFASGIDLDHWDARFELRQKQI